MPYRGGVDPDSAPLSTWQVLLRSVENVPLINLWWPIAFGVLTLLLIVTAVMVVRRHHRWWLFLIVPIAVVSLLFTVGFAANYQFSGVTTLGKLLGVPPYDPGSPDQLANPTGTWPRGQVIETTIPGPASDVGTHFAMVYLPPQYYTDRDATFPVIYALHGTPGGPDPRGEEAGPYDIFVNSDVDNPAAAAAKAGRPVVIIAPMVSPMSLDTECVDGPMGNWATYLTKDVPAWAAQYPRLRTGPANTAIGGFSMGGTCAQVTALRNPGQYSISGNLSGSPKAANDGGDAVLFGTGPGAAKAADYDSTAIITSQPEARSVRLWLGVGTGDGEPGLVADMTQFAATAKSLGMTVEFTTYPGGHSFDVWRPAFEDWIRWAAELLYREPGTDGPTPSPPSSSTSSSSSSSP